MTIYFKRQYGVDGTLSFPLRSASDGQFVGTAAHASGDIVISKDSGTATTFTGSFAAIPGGVTYSLAYTGTTHLQAKQIVLEVVDQSDPKIWLDEYLCIETEGNENAQHLDRTSGVLLATTVASASDAGNFVVTDKPDTNNMLLNSVCLLVDMSSPDTPPDRSFRNVDSYTGATGAVALASNADFTPAAGDLAIFFPASDVATAAEIAAAIAAFTLSGETSAGSWSKAVQDILTDTEASQTAESDLDTALGDLSADVAAVQATADLIQTDTEAAITERASLLADTEAVLADTEAAATSLSAILADTEATQTAQTSILADTEAVLADTEAAATSLTTIIADTEAILADTNELQTDWTDAGRLDLILDAILVDTEAIDITALLTDTEAILADTEGAGAIAAILVDTEASQTAEATILADTEQATTDTAAILTDTEASQTAETAILADTEAIAADAEAVLADTELWDSAQSEPTGVPTSNATPLTKLGVLYMMARNKITVDSGQKVYSGDDNAAEFAKALSDDGTTYTEAKVGTAT